MRFLVAGFLAAAVAWMGNRAALQWIGTRVIVISAPLLEELAKSSAAILASAPLVLTHATFGLVEGVYDAWGSDLKGFGAGLLSLVGHTFYGYITYLVWQNLQVFWAAVLAGYLVHMLWNMTVMKFVVKKRGVSR